MKKLESEIIKEGYQLIGEYSDDSAGNSQLLYKNPGGQTELWKDVSNSETGLPIEIEFVKEIEL